MSSRRACFLPLLSAILLPLASAQAGQVVSTMRNVNAVMQSRGFYLAPVYDAAPRQNPEDLAPVQSFEIIRPNGEAVTISRLFTSCSCVRLESSDRTFKENERAILDLRNVVPTPPAGQMYAIYVQITGPIRTTLRYDTFVQSSQFVAQVPAATPTATARNDSVDKKDDAEKAAATTTDAAIRRVQPDDDLEPVLTFIPDPHAKDAGQETPRDKYSLVAPESGADTEAKVEASSEAEETKKTADPETPAVVPEAVEVVEVIEIIEAEK